MSEREKDKLRELYHKVRKRRPWANENIYSGTARLTKDLVYAGASAAIPHAAGGRFRLKNTQLHIATVGGSALFNTFVQKTGQLFKGLDFTKSAVYDILDMKRYLLTGNEYTEFDVEREYNVADYFALRGKLQAEGNLPHNFQFTFESIDEDSLGFTDRSVASIFGLYLTWQMVIGGPVSLDRFSHWWNTELQAEDRGIRGEIGDGFMFAERLNRGETIAAVQQRYNQQQQYTPSAYIPDSQFQGAAEFTPVIHDNPILDAAAAAAIAAAGEA